MKYGSWIDKKINHIQTCKRGSIKEKKGKREERVTVG